MDKAWGMRGSRVMGGEAETPVGLALCWKPLLLS